MTSAEEKIEKRLKRYKHRYEECAFCKSRQFYVVFQNWRMMKQTGGVRVPTDVEFYCANCGELSSGVTFNEDLV